MASVFRNPIGCEYYLASNGTPKYKEDEDDLPVEKCYFVNLNAINGLMVRIRYQEKRLKDIDRYKNYLE
jgi:hypothetical protein